MKLTHVEYDKGGQFKLATILSDFSYIKMENRMEFKLTNSLMAWSGQNSGKTVLLQMKNCARIENKTTYPI